MKLSKSTIEKIHIDGRANIYEAKKTTNRYGTWITVTYATRYFKDGECTAVSTEKTTTIEGSTQRDLINYFCNL